MTKSTIQPKQKSSQLEATFVHGEDWVGLYINGILVAEGHSLSARDLVDALGWPVKSFDADQEWLEGRGSMPQHITEVRRAGGKA